METEKITTSEAGAAKAIPFFQQARMPELDELPGVLRLCAGVLTNRRNYDATICLAVSTVLPAYLDTRVCFQFPFDINPQEGNLISFITAPFASGKSYPMSIAKAVLRDIFDKDNAERIKEDKAKEELSKLKFSGAGKDGKKKFPKKKPLNIQILPTNSNSAAFLLRQKDLQHFHSMAVSILSECDDFQRYAGGKTAVSDLIRNAYECGLYSADRVMSDSVSGSVNIQWSILCATTHQQMLSFLGPKEIENGTLSRCTFAEIEESADDTVPLFRPFNEEFYNELGIYTERLRQAKPGLYLIPELDAWVARESKKVKDYVISTGDEAMKKMSYRAILSAARVGFTLWVTEGMTWTKQIDKYITFLYQNSLDIVSRLFGDTLKRLMELSHSYSVKKHTGKPSLFPRLPQTFTLEDVIRARVAEDYPSAENAKIAKLQIGNWKKAKLVRRLEKNRWEKILKATETKAAEPKGGEANHEANHEAKNE